MTKALRLTLALAAMLFATPALAITVTYDFVTLTPGTQPVPVDTSAGSDGFFYNVSGNVTNIRRTPWEDNTALHNQTCATCQYSSVSGGGGSATYNFSGTGDSTLAMMWGSPDPELFRNRITFYSGIGGTGSIVDFLDGSTVTAALLALGPVGSEAYRGYITVYITGITFASVVLSDAGSNAFEYVFNAIPQTTEEVPLPAGLLLLLSGLVGIGFLGRARAKSN